MIDYLLVLVCGIAVLRRIFPAPKPTLRTLKRRKKGGKRRVRIYHLKAI